MAREHDARMVSDTELGGDRVRDLFRELMQRALQELIDTELTEVIGTFSGFLERHHSATIPRENRAKAENRRPPHERTETKEPT